MAIELKQSLKLSQQLVMTPQLQQAIKLLQLNRLELAQHCQTEMMENPILEEYLEELEASELAEQRREKVEDSKPQELESAPKAEEDASLSINWDNFLSHQSQNQGGERTFKDFDPDLPSFEATLTRSDTLHEHVMAQVNLLRLSDLERHLAEVLIMNLDDDGYLCIDLNEVADRMRCSLTEVESILGRIQELDPIGIASRSLQECLLIQAKRVPQNDVLKRLIVHHMKDLERRNYAGIIRDTGLSKVEVMRAVEQLAMLEPKPGRQFYDESGQYITPDIYVYKVKDEYVIVQNEDGLPKLKISQLYQNLMKGAQGQADTRDYVNDKLRSALWLIRSIHQRQRTIYKVTESIVKQQRDFFDKGVASLKPMVLRDVADDIGMHESTVSRVTSNKYVHTPQGIFELKFFFNSGIKRVDGVDMASESVKEKIRVLIASESAKSPYSDQEIVELLRKQNIDIARRTVAKYRDMLGILSSSKRKQAV